MGAFERRKMGTKYREALTATVLTYIDEAQQLGIDPLSMSGLPITGATVLGWELGQKTGQSIRPKDSVWWVVVDPDRNTVVYKRKLADDLSKWRKRLNRQLSDWGRFSQVKKVQRRRRAAAGVIAVVVVAVTVAVIFTGGAAAPAAGGVFAKIGAAVSGSSAGAAASSGGAAAASQTGKVAKGLKKAWSAIKKGAAVGKDLQATAALMEQDATPEETKMIKQAAAPVENRVASATTPLYEQPMFWGAVTVGALALVGTIILVRRS